MCEPSTGSEARTTDLAHTSLLAVTDLRTHIETEHGTVRAVDGVSFTVDRGETVCLVGESGSGKSVTCESLTGIVPQPPADVVGGTVDFDGTSLLDADEGTLRRIRGDRIAHVFQNPQGSLDPVYTVGEQIAEAITLHRNVSEARAREQAIDLLRRVEIPGAATRVDDYPHEFSGGMRQRVAIAVALAAEPDLLVADEPTTAVDVTVQARLIELLRDLVGEGTAMLLVTHDLRVVSALADRVLVMFGGTIVERGRTEDLFERPAHPYTQALFDTYRAGSGTGERTARRSVPTEGCRFREECPHALDDCAGGEQPPFRPIGDADEHAASCVYYGPDLDPAPVLQKSNRIRSTGGDDD